MTAKEIIGKIENLLFASGESMPITGIAALLEEDEARINEVLEEEMAAVLDRAVGQRGLSYTKCPFERLEGKKVEKKPDRGPELSL